MMIKLQAGTLFTTQVMGYRVHAIGNSFSQIQSRNNPLVATCYEYRSTSEYQVERKQYVCL